MELSKIDGHRIPENAINRELKELYAKIPSEMTEYVNSFNARSDGDFISNPILLAATDKYCNAPKRMMVIGQETYTWLGEYNKGRYSADNSIGRLQNLYDIFVNEWVGYNSPIWNLYDRIQNIANKNGTALIFNNLAKIGYVEATGHDAKANKYLVDIFREEIRICRPDTILFLSGPNYDSLIEERFGKFSAERCIDGVASREFARLKFANPEFAGIKAFRTYHPAYLQRSKNRCAWVQSVYNYLETLAAE